ncbi:hypothetical protein ICY_04141 [Bacillus cereus BAG2X1-3]|nr:hypothetical protein ICY_04141 [Bacillus cereus BAG2X1-3]
MLEEKKKKVSTSKKDEVETKVAITFDGRQIAETIVSSLPETLADQQPAELIQQ